jgi:hypothetical protein
VIGHAVVPLRAIVEASAQGGHYAFEKELLKGGVPRGWVRGKAVVEWPRVSQSRTHAPTHPAIRSIYIYMCVCMHVRPMLLPCRARVVVWPLEVGKPAKVHMYAHPCVCVCTGRGELLRGQQLLPLLYQVPHPVEGGRRWMQPGSPQTRQPAPPQPTIPGKLS